MLEGVHGEGEEPVGGVHWVGEPGEGHGTCWSSNNDSYQQQLTTASHNNNSYQQQLTTASHNNS